MPEESKSSHFDFSSIEFPSDRITVGQLRRIEPEIMTSNRAIIDTRACKIDGIDMCRVEHILARQAWAKVAGLPDPDPTYKHHELVDNLFHMYKRYGIVQGKRETYEVVRRFEDDVAREAKRLLGDGLG